MPSQTEQDTEHLRILAVFHYVVAGLQALCASFPIIHLALGIAIVFFPEKFEDGNGAAPAIMGWFFILFAGAWILLGWTLAVCLVVAGRSLGRRRHYVFCFVVAVVAAVMAMPFGTVLGVLTIIVLLRPSVKEAFQAAPART